MNSLKPRWVILTLACGIMTTMAFESAPLQVTAAPIQQGDLEPPPLPDLVPVIVLCGPPVRVKISNQGTRPSNPSFAHVRVKQLSGQRVREQTFQTAGLTPGQSQEHSLPIET